MDEIIDGNLAVAGSITISPPTSQPPLILSAEAQGQTVIGLMADGLNKSINIGSGLTGGGNLTGDVVISAVADDGISVSVYGIAVDISVARDTWEINTEGGLMGGGTLSPTGILLSIDPSANFTWSGIHTFDVAGAPFQLGSGTYGHVVTGLMADQLDKTIFAGNGLIGGGYLNSDLTLHVGQGDGILVEADSVSVDDSVVRTTWFVNAGLGLQGGGALTYPSITLHIGEGDGIKGIGDRIYVDMDYAFVWNNVHRFKNTIQAYDIMPYSTDTYDLGSPTKMWRQSFISQINAVIFAEYTAQILAGWFIIPKESGILPQTHTIGSSSGLTLVFTYESDVTTTMDFKKPMTPGDFLLVRSHDSSDFIKAEYIEVGSLISGTTYQVTRDLADVHATDPEWPEGTPYMVLGQLGDGRIELNASDTPRISVIVQGSNYNEQTEHVRMGDLNGTLDYTAISYGFIAGNDLALTGDNGFSGVAIDADDGMRLFNTGIEIYDGASQTVSLSKTGSLMLGSDVSVEATRNLWFDPDNGLVLRNVRLDMYDGAIQTVLLDVDGWFKIGSDLSSIDTTNFELVPGDGLYLRDVDISMFDSVNGIVSQIDNSGINFYSYGDTLYELAFNGLDKGAEFAKRASISHAGHFEVIPQVGMTPPTNYEESALIIDAVAWRYIESGYFATADSSLTLSARMVDSDDLSDVSAKIVLSVSSGMTGILYQATSHDLQGQLYVSGALSSGPVLTVKNNSGAYVLYTENSGYTLLSGSLGLGLGIDPGAGISAPSSKLHIKDGTGGEQLRLQRGTGIVRITQPSDADNLYIYNNDASVKMLALIGATGRVGIGTITPGAVLDISDKSGVPTINVDRASGQPSIKSTDASGYLLMDSNGTAAALNWYTADNIALGQGGGSVGIGVHPPTARLDVNGDALIRADLVVTGALGSSWANASLAANWGSYNTTKYHPVGYKKFGDLVFFRGLVRRTDVPATTGNGLTAFTLPVGYRPLKAVSLTSSTGSGTICVFDIQTDGKVNFYGTAAAYAGMDGLSFSVA